MSKSVAVEGDMVTTPGSTPYPPADSGSWSATTVTYSTYANLKTNGKNVIYKAECKFIFSGIVSSIGVTVVGEDTVTLEANPKKLQSGQYNVLVDGDSKESSFGNKLEAKASNNLFTN